MKYTPWFPASEPPVRDGVYETRTVEFGCGCASYWDGTIFNGVWSSIELAHKYRNFGAGCAVDLWRGLSTNPNEPKRGQRTK